MDIINEQGIKTNRLISFNCKSLKRSLEGVRDLCRISDVVALQETWLLPHDLPLLNSIDGEFGCTGTSAVDTSAGLLSGRPYGGVAILWRKNAFQSVSVIKCDNVRVAAVKITISDRSVLIFSVYMPTNAYENLPVFTECLSVIRSIIEIEENLGVEACYVLGDFNAHPTELFYMELNQFCLDQQWSCVDIDIMGIGSDTYTYISDAHGCRRWLDHCIITESARKTIKKVWVKNDVYWSDHSPLVIECSLGSLVPKVGCPIPNLGGTNSGIIWGERQQQQIDEYYRICQRELAKLEIPSKLPQCCYSNCQNLQHKHMLEKWYNDLTDILSKAAISTCSYKCPRKGGYIIGWNKHVAEAHREARDKFRMWVLTGKPNSGRTYDEMNESRKIFKGKLKWCQDRQEQIKMDLLASNHREHNFKSFWKNTNKLNVKPSLPVSVGGLQGEKTISNLFKEHFRVASALGPSSSTTSDAESMVTGQGVTISVLDVIMTIKKMQKGKSPGHDGLSIEHFRYAGEKLPKLLSIFYTMCLSHAYLPEALMKTIVVPVIKNKTGDASDKANYRPISLATIAAKVLDSVLNAQLVAQVKLHDAQFGFKKGVSTESAILCLKHTVGYYTERKTPIYGCFLDLTKAFDLVSYDLLWEKMCKAGVSAPYISLLRFWYGHQKNQVRWAGALSDEYTLECGVRQGGLTSPLLFNLYVNDLIVRLSSTHVGCYIGETCFNNISYADDMVLLGPTVGSIRTLLSICESFAEAHGLQYNAKKSELLVFKSGNVKPKHVPPICLKGVELKVVGRFRYLGHIVTDSLKDDEDIERERRALAVRSNMLARRFTRCTDTVKITLFKAFCTSFYSSGLWVKYSHKARNALRVQYNNAFRGLLGLPRNCSASGMFTAARTDGFHAIMRKKAASLLQRLRGSDNGLLNAIGAKIDCPIVKYWVAVATGRLCG